jgi:hypothetical protein
VKVIQAPVFCVFAFMVVFLIEIMLLAVSAVAVVTPAAAVTMRGRR